MKLFLVTREDLGIEHQAVQAAHALQEFNIQHPEIARDWHGKSNTLVFLAVQDELALGKLWRKARDRCIPTSGFREPDRQNELTALAIGPQGKSLVRDLPLALRHHGKTKQVEAHPSG
jgi:peptidyl-tRNA hydrolase